MTALLYVTMTFFIIVCTILILLILIQKGRGGGLASAFGGAGGQTAFGSKTGDVLTWATSVVFAVFVVLAVALNLVANRINATRGGIANKAAPISAPAIPGSPQSSLPKAPMGDPGMSHPVLPMPMPTTLPSVQSIAPAMAPATTSAASSIERVSTTVPTTLP